MLLDHARAYADQTGEKASKAMRIPEAGLDDAIAFLGYAIAVPSVMPFMPWRFSVDHGPINSEGVLSIFHQKDVWKRCLWMVLVEISTKNHPSKFMTHHFGRNINQNHFSDHYFSFIGRFFAQRTGPPPGYRPPLFGYRPPRFQTSFSKRVS